MVPGTSGLSAGGVKRNPGRHSSIWHRCQWHCHWSYRKLPGFCAGRRAAAITAALSTWPSAATFTAFPSVISRHRAARKRTVEENISSCACTAIASACAHRLIVERRGCQTFPHRSPAIPEPGIGVGIGRLGISRQIGRIDDGRGRGQEIIVDLITDGTSPGRDCLSSDQSRQFCSNSRRHSPDSHAWPR